MTNPRGILVLALFWLLGATPAIAQDLDGDGVDGAADNCPAWPNPLQADSDANGVGDACECGDQNGDRTVDVRDLIAINGALFDPARVTELCDTTFDGECDVRDILGVRGRIFGGAAHCGRNPPAGSGAGAFVSAPESSSGWIGSGDPRMAYALDTTSSPPAEERVVEEGDIYRVLGGGRILNLNAYRGLQVIDVADVAEPRIVGRLAVSGSPVELYVVGDTAFVLLNYWQGYYGRREDVALASHDGAVVLAVDVSDPAAPVVRDRAAIPGYIHGSRLTRGGGRAALYLALGQSSVREEDGRSIYEARSVVRSFEVSAGSLVARPALDLGPSVPSAVQATPEVLLVARNYWQGGQQARVSIVDIRDPGGVMLAGGEVLADGAVQNQFNLDLYRGVLRVVSSYGGRNSVQTWNASNLSNPVPVDQEFFGANESLFATLFLGNKAFFVTFLRIDPFHAFAIDDAGQISPQAEFEVSGWNDFFRAVAQQTRLIGVGVDDQSRRSAAVSLYDITDLANPQPLIEREVVDAASTWSEASFDHRAFSVLEDAVDVEGPQGVRERGLVLLPFTGWNGQTYTSAVQIFSFSDRTLSRRGKMEHGTPVRRSFLAEPAVAANLSEEKLALHGLTDPDQPAELGSVELAPNYTRLFLYGDHAARVKDSTTYYAGWWGPNAGLPQASVEIIERAPDPDGAPVLTSFRIPAGAAIHQVGNLFVTLDQQYVQKPDGSYGYRTAIAVHDLSDPTSPALAGTLVTDRLRPSYGYYYPCPTCLDRTVSTLRPIAALPGQSVGVIPGGLVFLQADDLGRPSLEVLDLTRPAQPALAETVALGGESGHSLLTDGSDAWVSSANWAAIEGDARSFVRYYLQRIDLSTPSRPRQARPINVPGVLVAIEGDSLYTRDTLWPWGRTTADTGIARLRLRAGLAVVLARHVFPDQTVETLLVDGAGQVLVGHRDSGWSYVTRPYLDSLYYPRYPSPLRLSVLDALGLELLSRVEVDHFATLRHAQAGRALFQVSGGLLVFNLDDPAAPHPQAFFPTSGYPEQIVVDGRRIAIPAGRYGIYAFDIDEFNLLPPEELAGG
jgi:hypothetical protein